MKYKIRTEAFDFMQYFYSSAHRPLIRALIRFSGRLDLDALKRAVDLSASTVPVIPCVFSAQTHSWENRGFQAEQIVHVTESGQPDTEAERLLLDTIDLEKEPQLKIHLVRGPEADVLCVIISHLAADGGGFKQYLYVLASLYRSCLENPGVIVPPEPLDRDVRQVFRGMGTAEKIRILRSPLDLQKQERDMYLPLEEKKGEPVTVVRRISGEAFAALKRCAKKSGATINDYLLTAYGRAHCSMAGCSEFAIPCPVDLRKYLPEGARAGICNLTSNYQCRFSMKREEPFGKTLKKVKAQMSAQKDSRDCLKGPMLLDLLFTLLPFSAAKKTFDRKFTVPVVSFTNLGVLDWRKLDFGAAKVVDAYLTTAVKRPPSFQVSASTFGGCCTLSSNLYATEKNRRLTGRFLDKMLQELERATAGNTHKVFENSQNNTGGGSYAKGQSAGQQKKQAPESERANTRNKGKSGSKPKLQKAVHKK